MAQSIPELTMLSGTRAIPDSYGRQPHRTFGLRGADSPARPEPGAAADLVDDSGETVIGVVEHPFALAQVRERNVVQRGEWVGGRDDEDELLPRDRLERAVPPAQRPRADGEVRDSLLDGVLEEVAVPELVDADRDVRVPLVPDADVCRQHADGHRKHSRDLELAELERQRRACALPPSFQRTHSEPRLGKQRAAGRRERHPAGQAIDDGSFELFLERFDVLGQRRLRDAHPPGSSRERAFVDHCDEALELAKIHRKNLL